VRTVYQIYFTKINFEIQKDVDTDAIAGEMFWGSSFNFEIFTDENFDTIKTTPHRVGHPIFLQMEKTYDGVLPHSLLNKICFYLDTVTVSDTDLGSSINVIDETCYSDIVGARAYGESNEPGFLKKVVENKLQFSFNAFSFTKEITSSQVFSVVIKFCIKDNFNRHSFCGKNIVHKGADSKATCDSESAMNYRP